MSGQEETQSGYEMMKDVVERDHTHKLGRGPSGSLNTRSGWREYLKDLSQTLLLWQERDRKTQHEQTVENNVMFCNHSLLFVLRSDLPVGISQRVQGVFTWRHSRRDGCNLGREISRGFHQYLLETNTKIYNNQFVQGGTVINTKLNLFLTMHVLEFSPMKESLSTWVSLLARNGVWGLFLPSARIHSCRQRQEHHQWLCGRTI